MSKKTEQIRICKRKVVYTNPEYADLEAKRLQAYSYKCPWCSFWHLTRHPRI